MTEKDTPTIEEFTAESKETPEPTRVALDHPTVQVVNEEDLPEAAKPKEDADSTQEQSDGCPCVITRDEQKPQEDPITVVERELTDDGYVYKRTYVEDPSEVPEGVDLREGDRGGLYFEGSGQEFVQSQIERTQERLRNADFSDEQIEKTVERVQRHDDIAQESFGMVHSMAEEVGADIKKASHRVKGVGSSLQKAYQSEEEGGSDDYDDVDELTDMHGSMMVVDDLEDAQQMYENFLSRDDLTIEKSTDHTADTDNPYRAHHLVIEMDEGVFTEIQIKEERMSQIASASHSLLYKAKEEAPVDEIDAITEGDIDEDGALADELESDVKSCLTQQADLQQGLIDEEEIDCEEQAFEVIQQYMELQGYL